MKKLLAVFLLILTLAFASGCSARFWASEEEEENKETTEENEENEETDKEDKEEAEEVDEETEEEEDRNLPANTETTGKIKISGPEGVRPKNATAPSAAATMLASFSAIPDSTHRNPRP